MAEVGLKGLCLRVQPEEEEGGGVQQTQLFVVFGRVNDLLGQKYVGLAEGKHYVPLQSPLCCNFLFPSLGLLEFVGDEVLVSLDSEVEPLGVKEDGSLADGLPHYLVVSLALVHCQEISDGTAHLVPEFSVVLVVAQVYFAQHLPQTDRTLEVVS